MYNSKQSYKNSHLLFLPVILVFLFSSCTLFTVVKNEPPNHQPYIFETKVTLNDDGLKKAEKIRLEAGLYGQLDDSLAARKLDKVLWEVLKKPQALDTALISKSAEFMNNYLSAEGYFHDSINYTTTFKNVGAHQRAYILFNVWAGKITTIDSISYTFQNDSLQRLADKNKANAEIKKGSPFAQTPISSELTRLEDLYKNNGYLQFSRNDLYVLWDTLDLSLLQPTLDPFEQALQIEKLKQRRLNPLANIEIRQKELSDSSSIRKYYVGNVTIYPELNADTTVQNVKRTTIGNVTIVQHSNRFKPKIFPQYIYLHLGELYKQSRQLRTFNRLNSLGTWRLVDVGPTIRNNNSDTVDFNINLSPAPKYNFTTNLEGSFSQSVFSGNFVGLGLNVGLQNRNFLRSANLLSTNVRYGVELGGIYSQNFIQTQQISLSNSLVFPRFVFPGMNTFRNNFRGNIQSVFSINAASTERINLYNLSSFNTSWGYDFGWRSKEFSNNNRTYNLSLKFPNIEYSYLKKRAQLDSLIIENPSIQYLFSDGLITSIIANFSMPWNSANHDNINLLKLNIEASGLGLGLLHTKFIDDQLYRFVKFDAEYAKLYKFTSKTGLVLRGFAGIGYELEATANPNKRSQLPFFKQYFSGGPNSMRAWQLRRLGPGSVISNFDGSGSVPDRFGDVQLEANIEYRMPVFNIAGIPINGAIFTDAGNIWALKKSVGNIEERFALNRLGKDIAIGSGAGIRVDFGFFVIRLDYAYKVKDPSPDIANASYQNKFFAYPFFKGSQLQIGIGYPFIF